jgi:hypothetical protein
MLVALSGAYAAAPYDFLANGIREAKVTAGGGVPRLSINNQPVPPLIFYINARADRLGYLAPQVALASRSGIHIYSMQFSGWPWSTGEAGEKLDFSQSDQLMDRFLAIDPQAVFLLRVGVWPPPKWQGWANRTKDQDILYSDGSTALCSLASPFYRDNFLGSLRKMIGYYESSAYGKHILGYHITGQNTGEWFPLDYREKGLDYSPVNQDAFRAWLRNKYGSDRNVNHAWGRGERETPAIPIAAPGRFPIHGAKPGERVEAFYRVPEERPWIDYSEYVSDAMSQRILDIAQVVKQETHGNKLTVFFYGYIFELSGSMNGHLRMDRLLASPWIDALAAPISYSDRPVGGSSGFMTAVDSVAAHGKLWMNEDDLHTYLATASALPQPGFNAPPINTFEDTYNLLLRNMASALIHRAGTWWMDLNVVGSFNDARLWKVMQDFGLPLYGELYRNPKPYRPEVALIVDSQSVDWQKSGGDLVKRGRAKVHNEIAKTGATVGYYYLDDFLSGDLPRAKVYVFCNTFYLTGSRIAAIHARLNAEKATAIWQYAPGYLSPNGPAVDGSQALTGFRFKVSDGCTGTNGEGLLKGIAWGWNPGHCTNVMSPRLVVADPGAAVLGRYASDKLVSTASRTVQSFRSVFAGDLELDRDMLRELFRQAGVHIWTDGGEVVQTDGSLLTIHAPKAGPVLIHLPAGVTAAPFSGDLTASGAHSVTANFTNGETRWFRLNQAR